ncbi:hypothetical protein PISMIDRAFT_14173 [Pisolithus microcarpus 441]|uniref:Unplaced genomic scaffold scaffold_115, whole genome shotgun sequence n=1 Tax=Pisolithus microcarpus 441 TaxID=765257 RepID=A0A0C9Z8F6_9AGAM|nr:hypothetical protein PISMIDRAFT_14173 [Pisolithus microcarpus 441]
MKAGIEHRRSVAYAHQQNGKAERGICTVEGQALAALNQASLSAAYFREAVLTIGYLWNLTTMRVLPENKTPFEMLYGYKPDVSHLQVFSSQSFSHILPERCTKNGPHSSEALFMGYPDGIKGWRLRDCATGAFFNSRDIIFDEESVMHSRDLSTDCHSPQVTTTAPSSPMPTTLVPPTTSQEVLNEPCRLTCTRVLTEKGKALADDLQRLRDRARLVAQGMSEGVDSDSGEGVISTREEDAESENKAFLEHQDPSQPGYDMSIPPATYEEAMKRSDHAGWMEAMKKELGTMKDMGVWTLVELPPGRKLVGNRWVFEFKPVDLKGGSKFKACLVVQGFSQVPGVDFHQTYAPVARQASVKLLIAMVSRNNWELDCFNAKRAFLHGKLTEGIYMKQPRGFEQHNNLGILLVCRLLCSLYGLKQAAFDWYVTLSKLLEELGFSRSDINLAVFIFDRAGEDGRRVICIIVWHVDDGLGGCNSRYFLNWVKGKIGERFGISDLGPVSLYLGIKIERRWETCEVWIHQESYIDHLCEEYGLEEANLVSLPMDPSHPFGQEMDIFPDILDLAHAYRKIVGELTYLATCSRPDITQAVQCLAQQCTHAKPCHFAAAKHLLHYLKGTKSLCIHYGNPNVNHLPYAFSDSDWAMCPADHVSVMGYVWFFYGSPVAHASKKQHTLALSSTEAEYMALAACAQEGLWLHLAICSFHQTSILPFVIHADNTSTVSLSSSPVNHPCTKHIDVHYHFLREHVSKGVFALRWIPTHQNVMDILTKPLACASFQGHQTGLSMVSH